MARPKHSFANEMFTLCVQPTEYGNFRYTIVNPEASYCSGQRDTLAEVNECLEREMREYARMKALREATSESRD
jgi:putative hemolysin